MSKPKSNFWLGVAIGALGGLLTAQKLSAAPRMPNAKTFQRVLSEKLGLVDAGVFMARVQQRYAALKARRPVFDNPVFNFHVVVGILPGLSLYQTLLEDGLNQEEAIAEVHRIFEVWFDQAPHLNMRVNQLMNYTPHNFDFFRRLTRFVTDQLFPAPGWQYDLVEDHHSSLAFNMRQCFYIQVLEYYQSVELTPVFCKLDDYLMAAMPASIRWGRTQTMGLGAECCDFCWDYARSGKLVVESDSES
jgi:hypothetical protein